MIEIRTTVTKRETDFLKESFIYTQLRRFGMAFQIRRQKKESASTNFSVCLTALD